MDNRNSVHTRELAICKKSPIGVHHWVQSIEDSPVFHCIYCEGFRAFNIRSYRFNPYYKKEFMKIFPLEELPILMKLLDKRHKDAEIEDNPEITAKNRERAVKASTVSKNHRKSKGIFDSGPKPPKKVRMVVSKGVLNFR